MHIVQTPTFERAAKKLHANQKKDLDHVIVTLSGNPYQGDEKSADLAGVRVIKFSMAKQRTLLAYLFEQDADRLTLLALGVHENFYRDLKR